MVKVKAAAHTDAASRAKDAHLLRARPLSGGSLICTFFFTLERGPAIPCRFLITASFEGPPWATAAAAFSSSSFNCSWRCSSAALSASGTLGVDSIQELPKAPGTPEATTCAASAMQACSSCPDCRSWPWTG